MANVGDGSFACVKTRSGGGRRAGILATSSWAARSYAAAPRPKIRIDVDRMIAANKKRKPGSIGADSAWREFRERG
jgi:hypothetical protein